ncbi:uncharacterized protein LOC131432549 [Malaya genurostris]|uniref:uncharacterized protein LOC131432549 n=1 Tax=Malaya genurostris TaxID=325434 RepID=UPI0026F3C0CA|nr:uncharacterized protein LOC131432549 [Malaya genurostris]
MSIETISTTHRYIEGIVQYCLSLGSSGELNEADRKFIRTTFEHLREKYEEYEKSLIKEKVSRCDREQLLDPIEEARLRLLLHMRRKGTAAQAIGSPQLEQRNEPSSPDQHKKQPVTSPPLCYMCKDRHFLYHCGIFTSWTSTRRLEFVERIKNRDHAGIH